MDAASNVLMFESRLIAFLDILGFSRRLETSSIQELHREYADLIDEARTAVFGGSPAVGTNFAKAQFLFDSVVLVSHELGGDKGPQNVFHFISAIAQLLEQTFARQMPLRGAIAQGDFLDDVARQVFLSSAFPRLVHAEREQDWCGAVLLPDALDAVFSALHGATPTEVPASPAGLLLEYDVAVKDTQGKQFRRRSWCVNWVWFSDAPHLAGALSWIAEPKRTEVRAFIDYVNSLPHESLHLTPLPDGVRPVVAVRFQAARGGLRLKFLDEQGRGANLPEGTTVNLHLMAQQAAGTGQLKP